MTSIFKISSTILKEWGTSDPIKSSTAFYITVVEEPRESFIFTLVCPVTGFMKYLKMTPEPVRQQTGCCSNNVKLQQKQDSRPLLTRHLSDERKMLCHVTAAECPAPERIKLLP